jgi:hypothetical protein
VSDIDVEVRGLDDLEATLERAQREIVPEIERVMHRTMNEIRRGAQRRVRGHPHLRHYPRTFTYDVTTEGLVVTGEVGPEHEKGGQALLGHLIEHPHQVEHGTLTRAPLPHWRPATDEELPVFRFYAGYTAARILED